MPAPSRTIRVAANRVPGWVERFGQAHGGLTSQASDADWLLRAADGALARLWDLWPGDRSAATSLDEWLARATSQRTVGVLLVRKSAHAVGVATGTTWLAHHCDGHYVQGRTKAGGWSQQRYARRRANQAEHAFASVIADADRVISPYQGQIDAMLIGGDRAAVASVLADPRLAWCLPLRTTHPLAGIGDPSFSVLTDVLTHAYDVAIDIFDPPQ